MPFLGDSAKYLRSMRKHVYTSVETVSGKPEPVPAPKGLKKVCVKRLQIEITNEISTSEPFSRSTLVNSNNMYPTCGESHVLVAVASPFATDQVALGWVCSRDIPTGWSHRKDRSRPSELVSWARLYWICYRSMIMIHDIVYIYIYICIYI